MRVLPALLGLLFLLPIQNAAGGSMPLCGSGPRTDCVVDGDTLWLGREKIRLAGIDAPESDGRCASERDLAARAKSRLAELMTGARGIERQGIDRYGRTLAVITTDKGSINEALIVENLARPWQGRRQPWCVTP